jgi:hypothetical protein
VAIGITSAIDYILANSLIGNGTRATRLSACRIDDLDHGRVTAHPECTPKRVSGLATIRPEFEDRPLIRLDERIGLLSPVEVSRRIAMRTTGGGVLSLPRPWFYRAV